MHLPLARTDKLIIREMPEETLVFDQEIHKSHCLNDTAALVWKHCDGRTTVAEVAAILHQQLGLPVSEILVRLALEQLGRRNLLQQTAAPVTANVLPDHDRLSRRDALKKLAIAAASLPLIMTLTAQRARAQASRSDFGDDPAAACSAQICESAFGTAVCPNPTPLANSNIRCTCVGRLAGDPCRVE